MAVENERPKQKLDGIVITVDRRKCNPKEKLPTQRATDSTPVGRWLQETPSEQPWNALASFDFVSSWNECTAQPHKESLLADNGSVDVDDGK
jgi:hypothetical protein